MAAGCLYHKPGGLSTTYPGGEPESVPVVKETPPDPPEPHASVLPDYNLQPTVHQPAYFEPTVAPVKLETGFGMPRPLESFPSVPASAARAAAPEAPLVTALQGAVEKHPAEARKLLEKPDRSDREQLLSLVKLAADIDQKELDKLSEDDSGKVLEQLRLLTTQLKRHAPLRLDKACFCKRIDGFGQYQPLSGKAQFCAGSDGRPGDRIQVYSEVRNFISQSRDERYETRLSSSLEILDEDQRPVATMTPETCTDVSQTPRQDYFLNFQFHVPARLKPGSYTLRVVVKDLAPPPPGQKRAARTDRRTLDFQVCPPGGARSARASR